MADIKKTYFQQDVKKNIKHKTKQKKSRNPKITSPKKNKSPHQKQLRDSLMYKNV